MTKDMWMFLAIWNGIGAVYWYYRFTTAMKLMSDPKFLKRALEILKDWQKHD